MFEHLIGKGLNNSQVFTGTGRSVEIKPEIASIKGGGDYDGHWDVVYNKKRLTRLGKDVIVGLVGGIPLGIIGFSIISALIK